MACIIMLVLTPTSSTTYTVLTTVSTNSWTVILILTQLTAATVQAIKSVAQQIAGATIKLSYHTTISLVVMNMTSGT